MTCGSDHVRRASRGARPGAAEESITTPTFRYPPISTCSSGHPRARRGRGQPIPGTRGGANSRSVRRDLVLGHHSGLGGLPILQVHDVHGVGSSVLPLRCPWIRVRATTCSSLPKASWGGARPWLTFGSQGSEKQAETAGGGEGSKVGVSAGHRHYCEVARNDDTDAQHFRYK